MAKMILLALALFAFSATPVIAQGCADFPDACGTFVPANPCQCDSICVNYGDCCDDVCEICNVACPGLCSNDAFGLCGEFIPGNPCQCDSLCVQYADCCEDVCETCDLGCPALCSDPGPGADGNLCGTIIAQNGCQCDASCADVGNCCDDSCDVCGFGCPDPPSPPPLPPAPPGTGICEYIGCSDDPLAFSEKNNCFCDSSCVFFNDCCDDSCDVCGFCKFGEGEDNIPGDSPLNSIIIDAENLPQSFTQSNAGYPNILDANGPEVFYNFTATTDITIYITACDADFDVAIVVYDFAGEENPDDFSLALVVVTNDDPQFCGEGSTGAGTAIIVPAGETGIIQVEAVNPNGIGTFTLVVNEVSATCSDGVFNFCEGVTTTPQAVNPVDGCECFEGCENCCPDYLDSCTGASCAGDTGDVNIDGIQNVLDIIAIANFILGGEDPDDPLDDCVGALGDLNSDGLISVLDIVSLVNSILGIDL